MERQNTSNTTGTQLAAPITAVTTNAIKSAVVESYVPKFFVTSAIEIHQNKLVDYIKKEGLDVPSDIMHYVCTSILKGSFNLYSTELHTIYTPGRFSWLKNLPKLFLELWRTVIGLKTRIEAQEMYNKQFGKIRKKYTDYETNHEAHLKKIQLSIDNINKVKPILKDYILQKLSQSLNEMGIESKVSDYPMDHLDYRNFPIKKEYDIITARKLTMEENVCYIEEWLAAHPIMMIINFLKATEIRSKLKKLQLEEELTTAKIKADLTQMEAFEVVLDNIANIFKDTMDVFVPLMEKIISDIKTKYNSQYDAIPDEVLLTMQSVSKILKDLTEKKILKESFSLADIEEVKKYSNNLSIRYDKLKNTILKMAS